MSNDLYVEWDVKPYTLTGGSMSRGPTVPLGLLQLCMLVHTKRPRVGSGAVRIAPTPFPDRR